MNTPYVSRRHGFTLIELLTVIAIIGILAAIIIPTVGKVRETAKSSQCTSNIRQVGMSLRLLAGDRRDAIPRPTNNPQEAINGQVVPSPTWHDLLRPYLPMRDNAGGAWFKGHHPVMTCPSIKWSGIDPTEAGASFSLAGGAVGVNGVNPDPGLERKLVTIQNPSTTPWLIDGAQASASGTGSFYAKYWLRNSEIISDVSANTNAWADFRHGDAVNVCMADGSVKRIKRNEWVSKYPSIGAAANRAYMGLN